jgi:CheY-like chemotaxis protein
MMVFGGGKRQRMPVRQSQGAGTASVARRDALIMAVDDDATSRAAIIDVLEDQGYSVHVVSTFAAWDAAWRSGPAPDLLVLDIMLAERKGGYEILRALRQADDHTPVVMVSSRNTPSDEAFAKAQQANAFVSKVRGEFDHPLRGLVATVNRLLSS